MSKSKLALIREAISTGLNRRDSNEEDIKEQMEGEELSREEAEAERMISIASSGNFDDCYAEGKEDGEADLAAIIEEILNG